MRFRTKLAMASAAAALMAGTAQAATTLVRAADNEEIDAMNVITADGDGGQIGEDGVTLNLAAGSEPLQQSGTLVVRATSDNLFGLVSSATGNFGDVRIDLTGTGFKLNGTPSIGSSAAGTTAADECADLNFGTIGGGGTVGATFVEWNDIDRLALCDGASGTSSGGLTIELPVIMTDTSLGTSVSVSIAIESSADDVVRESAALATPVAVAVAPFEAAVVADASPPVLSVSSAPAFSAFTMGSDGDVGDVAVAPTGGLVVTDIATEALIGDPAQIDVTVQLENATGIGGVTLDGTADGAIALTQSTTTPTLFTGSVTGTTDLTVAEFLGGSTFTPPASPTGPSIVVALAGDAGVAAQNITATITSLDGASAEIASGGASGSLAPLTREGATEAFEWVAMNSAFVNNVFRITGLSDPLPNIFVSASGLNNGQTVTETNISGMVTANNGELQLTGPQIGSILGVVTSGGVVRGRVSITVEAPDAQVDIDRLWVNSSGGIDNPDAPITGN